MNNAAIGILDSGVGGLSIWKEIVRELPLEATIYIADSKNAPYGSRTVEEVCNLADLMVKFLLNKKVKLIVVACNTITVSCLDSLRKDYPEVPIVGIAPVIKTAAKLSKNKRIGVISTVRTAKSQYLKSLIGKFAQGNKVYVRGTNELVPLVEQGEFKGERVQGVLRRELSDFQKKDIDSLVLGCSHYPFLRESIEKILGNGVQVLDSGAAVARQVKRILDNNNALAEKEARYEFYTTSNREIMAKIIERVEARKSLFVVKSVSL